MEFLSPVHDILLWKLCINCNFYFKESYNHSKLLRIFKVYTDTWAFFTKYKFSSFFVNRYFALLIMI